MDFTLHELGRTVDLALVTSSGTCDRIFAWAIHFGNEFPERGLLELGFRILRFIANFALSTYVIHGTELERLIGGTCISIGLYEFNLHLDESKALLSRPDSNPITEVNGNGSYR